MCLYDFKIFIQKAHTWEIIPFLKIRSLKKKEIRWVIRLIGFFNSEKGDGADSESVGE